MRLLALLLCLTLATAHAQKRVSAKQVAMKGPKRLGQLVLTTLERAFDGDNAEAVSDAATLLGMLAPDGVYEAFLPDLRRDPNLLKTAQRARELRAAGQSDPPQCDGEAPPPSKKKRRASPMDEVCAAVRRGFDGGRGGLVHGLQASDSAVRREAATQLAHLGGAKALPLLEAELGRALGANDIARALDYVSGVFVASADHAAAAAAPPKAD